MNREDAAAATDRIIRVSRRRARRNGHAARLVMEVLDMHARTVAVTAAQAARAPLAAQLREHAEAAARIAGLEADAERAGAGRDQAQAEAAELERQVTTLREECGEQDRALMAVIAQREAAGQRIEDLQAQFPACPGCGCRWPEEPDQRECGCDEGCNDGDLPPGVQVLTNQRDVAEQRLADVQAEHAKRDALRKRQMEAVQAESDRLKAQLAAMTRPGPELASLPELGVANEANTAVPAGEAGAEPATNRARTAAAARRRPGAGTRKGQDGTEAPGATQGGTEESGFTE